MLLTYVGGTIVDTQGNLSANIFFTIAVLIGLTVTLMIKAQMKRQNAIDA